MSSSPAVTALRSAISAATAAYKHRHMLEHLTAASRSTRKRVGWLGSCAASDGTVSFKQALAQCTSDGSHGLLPASSRIILIPGIFASDFPGYMEQALIHFKNRGVDVHLAEVSGEGSTAHNAARLAEQIHRMRIGDSREVVLVGHSKGGLDACAAAAELGQAEATDAIAGIVALQSPYAGSPAATDMLSDDALLEMTGATLAALLPRDNVPQTKRAEQVMLPLESLTYDARARMIAQMPAPPDIPCVSFHTHVATSPSLLTASATFLYRQYGNASNDGAVLRVDAEIPGSTAVRPSEECDHMQAEFATQWPPKTKMPLSGSDVLSSTSIGSLVVRANNAVSSLVGGSKRSTQKNEVMPTQHAPKRLRARQGELHEALVAQCLEQRMRLQQPDVAIEKALEAASENARSLLHE